MGILKEYIPRKRKLEIVNDTLFDYDFTNIPKHNYSINEFKRRMEKRLIDFANKNSLDYLTSRHLGIKELPFILINTKKNYVYGITKIFYYPIFKFNFYKNATYNFHIHNPIDDSFYFKERPLGIVVKDYFKEYDVLIGYSAAYFIEGLEHLFYGKNILTESLLNINVPKNRISYYTRLLNNKYPKEEAIKLRFMLKISENLIHYNTSKKSFY